MEESIIGGVSPMKRRGKSRGKRSGGTVIGDTRYKRDKWQKPPSGGTTGRRKKQSAPAPTKPYVIKDGKKKDKFGNTYSNDEEGFKKFKKATDAYNEKQGTTTKKTEKVLIKKGEEGTEDETIEETTYVPGGDNTASITTNKMLGSPGKYKLGGYRAMKAFTK